MKKKDLIVYAGAAVLLAFSTQQVKADEQVAADQTSENTSAVVLKTTTVSETQNIATDGVKTDQAVQTEKSVVTETITRLLIRELATRLYQRIQHLLWELVALPMAHGHGW